MKKTLLASALFFGIHAYAAIPDDINARADLVEQRNALTTQNIGKYYQQYLGASPLLDKIDIQTRNYKRGENGATAQSIITIDFNESYFGGEEFPIEEFILNSTLDYSDAVAKEGKLAVIRSELDAESLAKALDIAKDSNDFKEMSEVLKHLEMTTTLLDDGKLTQHLHIKPFDTKSEDGVHLAYEGFDYITETTDAHLEYGYGKTTIRSGKFEGKNTKPTNDGPKNITLLPFAGAGEYRDNGEMNLEVKPFELRADDIVIKAEKFTGEGKNLQFDTGIATFLGYVKYQLHNIAIGNAQSPEAVYVKTFTLDGTNEKSGDLYKTEGNLEILPVTESFSALTGGMSDALGVKSVTAAFTMDKFSAKLWQDFNELQTGIQELAEAGSDPAKAQAAQADLNKRGDAMLAEAGANGLLLKLNLAVNAEPGNATLDGHVEFLKGSKMTVAEIQAAFDAQSPTQLVELLGKNLRFELNVVIPKAIVDAVGAGAMIDGNPFIPLEGDNYKLHIKNDDKGIYLNGQPAPL